MTNRSKKLYLRVSEEEKTAFEDAAELAGIGLAAWMRERLKLDAAREVKYIDTRGQVDRSGTFSPFASHR